MTLLRRFLIILIAANLLLALWSSVRPADIVRVSPWQDASLRSLTLLSEHAGELQVRLDGQDEMQVAAQDLCLMRGPFNNEEEAEAAMAGADFAFRIENVSSEAPGALRYRAMIAPSESLAGARENLASVIAAIERLGGGIDTYLVTSGALANSVSLGLFNEHSNALSVQSALASENINVLVEPEIRLETRVWVLSDDAKAIEFIDETSAVGGFVSVPDELSENLCEMIAQAQ